MKKTNLKECAGLLLAHDDILLITHSNPDGDTVGSAAALCLALRRAGKNAYLYPNTQITEKLLLYAQPLFPPLDFRPGYTVAVDAATEQLLAHGFSEGVDLCIDHHPSNSHYAKSWLVRGEKAACGEIILDLIKKLNGGVSKEEADLLYIAISTDTGCFQYSNTNSATFKAAAELLEAGADNTLINTAFFRKVSPARLRLEGMIYSTMTFHRDGKIAVVCVTREMLEASGVSEDDLDDLAGLSGRAEGSVLNITIREMNDGNSKVSLRSDKTVNSSDICAVFGGGGHAMAAGCTIMGTTGKAKEMLLAVIDEVWK